MLFRKFAATIENFLKNEPNKILLVNGARQIGKSYIIRYVGKKLFKNYVEINFQEDKEHLKLFETVHGVEDFYIQLGAIAGNKLGKKDDTLVFLDEIQSYPHMFTMLKFLNQEARYTYIASGSQLGIALSQTASVPIGSISIEEMYPLDFEEFLIAMGCGAETIAGVKEKMLSGETLNESMHNYMLQQFKTYLLVGGFPDAINEFLKSHNIAHVRKIHRDIHALYRINTSQYETENKLVIRRIYDMIPSNMENIKKRVVVNRIEDTKSHKLFKDYANEFEYLINSGIAVGVQAVSNPNFPLLESEKKNLLKLYLNDVGLLTYLLYGTNVHSILQDQHSTNLGAVYETVVAQELHAHGHVLHYYDNKHKGEVDFLIDDYSGQSVVPIEVKSGLDFKKHTSLDKFTGNTDYKIKEAYVLSNNHNVAKNGKITYLPVYSIMFFASTRMIERDDTIIPHLEVPVDLGG